MQLKVESSPKMLYPFIILLFMLSTKISNQWHRSFLAYAFGYTETDPSRINDFYMITIAFPEL